MRKYAYFDNITRGQVTDGLHNGTIPQDEHDAYFFLVAACNDGFTYGFTTEALAIAREYMDGLRESAAPRLARHEDKIMAALHRAELADRANRGVLSLGDVGSVAV